MSTEAVLCQECANAPDLKRQRESSGYCPETCDACGGCTYCDGSC